MTMQWLAASSDALLAAVTLGLAWPRRRSAPALALGLLFIALAAFIGLLRYAGSETAIGPHRFFTALASGAGFVLLGYGLAWPADPLARRPQGALALALFAVVLAVGLPHLGLKAWLLVAPSLGATAIGLAVLRRPCAIGPLLGWALLLVGFAVNLLPQHWASPLFKASCLHLLLASALPLLLRLSASTEIERWSTAAS